ncbi:glycoside hydrolase [Sphingomonas sp.]|uniref:glycoside hydrolase n=1 Tax=Sphingomonas sp. TaxID=28214 RepID=UPI0025DABAA9|nr:glycoside hydrolase [Sphingomonas sp.]
MRVDEAITPPPPALGLDPFYAKYLSAGGIPVVASAKVPDRALRITGEIIDAMLEHRPDLRAALVAMHLRVGVMAPDETTTDLPEQRDWKKPPRDAPQLTFCERKHYDERIGRLTDRQYWDARARGMAGLYTTAATENLLGDRSSRYYGENIFVHEFAHDVLMAIRQADPALSADVDRAYAEAVRAGRWKGEYAGLNVDEYWAEGSQTWFNSNYLAVMDGVEVLSDDDLRRYDAGLYAALARAYGTNHHIAADAFYQHPARVPPGPIPKNTAEVC